jgi:hypothetical protein
MLNFKEWIVNESKFMQLDKDQQEDVDLIADKILEIVQTNSEKDLYVKMFYQKMLIGEIKRKDGRRPVPVYLKHENTDTFGLYNPKEDEIIMNLKTMIKFKDRKLSGRQIPSIINTLSHEAIHAIDPKFNPQIINPEKMAKKASEKKQYWSQGNMPSYYKSPAEFDAYGMGIVSNIRWKFNKSDEQGKNEVISGLENLLRTGDDDIIDVISKDDYVAMLHWKTKPTLWRKFQQRLFNLLQELKSEQIT